MHYLADLRLRNKLGVMLIFPLLGLIYFAYIIVPHKYDVMKDMQQLKELVIFSIKLNNNLHEIQRERGISAIYLKSGESRFAKQLNHEYQRTNEVIAEFNTYLQNTKITQYGEKFQQSLKTVNQLLATLPALREKISKRQVDEYEAVKLYTHINTEIINFITKIITISINTEILSYERSFISLINAKEKAGEERSLLGIVFSQQYFETKEFRYFIELVAEQKLYLNRNIYSYLTDKQKAIFKEKLNSPYIEETNKVRQRLYEAESDGLLQDLDPQYWFDIQTAKIDILKELEDMLSQDLFDKAEEIHHQAKNEFTNTLIIIIFSTVLTLLFIFIVTRGVTQRLKHAVDVAQAIAQGNLGHKIEITAKDETGLLLKELYSMQQQLYTRIEEDQRIANRALRINHALDSASTSVIITDKDYKIIYINTAAYQLFSENETIIHQDLPNFSADKLLHAPIDELSKDAFQQHKILDDLQSTHSMTHYLGGLTLKVVINPVINKEGERLGIVFEFANRTLEVATEEEINQVVQAASQGDYSQRIVYENKTGFFKVFSKSINQVMGANHQVLKDNVRIFSAMSKGDLTQKITHEYVGSFEQLRTDANATIDKLTEIIKTIKHTADIVTNTASEISKGNISLNQRTEEQAASLEETAASMEEMTSTVQRNAENAAQATQLAASARERAEEGGSVVGSSVKAMNDISESSKKVADIVSVIDDIAFQTNLLALNAAVEAARAGEQGRGFAVVATEVRSLAQRSAEAAKEIKALIKDSVINVEEGVKYAHKSGDTLNEIMTAVKKVSDIIAEIAAASQEQSSGIHQVNKAVTQMDEMTQQNAALVEEATAASEEMSRQASSLKDQMNFFYLGQYENTQSSSEQPSYSAPDAAKQATNPFAKAPLLASDETYNEDDWKDF